MLKPTRIMITLAVRSLGTAIQANMQYRVDMWFGILGSAIGMALVVVALKGILGQTGGEIAGWHFAELMVLAGTAQLALSLMDFFLYPNLNAVPSYVREGEMDGILLKPVDPLFLVSVKRVSNVGDFAALFLALGIILYGLIDGNYLAYSNIILFVVMFFCGMVILYAMWASLVSVAFWAAKAEDFSGIFYFMEDFATFPIAALPPSARFVFSFILPVAFVINVPAQAAIGTLSLEMALAAVGFATLAMVGCRFIWRAALRAYTSASS